jgi:hypothetical protein
MYLFHPASKLWWHRKWIEPVQAAAKNIGYAAIFRFSLPTVRQVKIKLYENKCFWQNFFH